MTERSSKGCAGQIVEADELLKAGDAESEGTIDRESGAMYEHAICLIVHSLSCLIRPGAERYVSDNVLALYRRLKGRSSLD